MLPFLKQECSNCFLIEKFTSLPNVKLPLLSHVLEYAMKCLDSNIVTANLVIGLAAMSTPKQGEL